MVEAVEMIAGVAVGKEGEAVPCPGETWDAGVVAFLMGRLGIHRVQSDLHGLRWRRESGEAGGASGAI